MLIMIANSKGGSHKTSLATSILAESTKQGKAAVGIDLDTINLAATKWGENRSEAEGKFYPLSGNIKDELDRVRRLYDLTVVDAGGYDNVEIRIAMSLADVVLIPLKVGSLDNIEGFRNIVDLVAELNPLKETPAKVYGVVVGAKAIGGGAELNRAIDEIVGEPLVTPTKTTISDRIWYGRAVDAKLGLTEYVSPDPRDRRHVEIAIKEFMELYAEIFDEQ